jgi:hypothetical protein
MGPKVPPPTFDFGLALKKICLPSTQHAVKNQKSSKSEAK